MREEKLAQARDHMSLVKKCAALRDELSGGEARARKAAAARDRARTELQQCAAELVQAQEHTAQARGPRTNPSVPPCPSKCRTATPLSRPPPCPSECMRA